MEKVINLLRIWKVVTLLLLCHLSVRASEDVNLKLEDIITSQIDNSVEPCEDFYAHACGNYAEQNPSTNYQEIISYLDHQYNTIILNLMETSDQNENQLAEEECQSFLEKTRVYLKSCRGETERDLSRYFVELKPAQNLEWPILEEKVNKYQHSYTWPHGKQFDLWSLLGQLQSYGMSNVLINQEIEVDSVGQLSIILEPAFTYNNNKTLPDVNILKTLLIFLGAKNIDDIVNNLSETEEVLLDILNNSGSNNENSLEMLYSDLESLYPNLNLNLFLKELLGRDLPPDTYILLRKPSYFQHLNKHMWTLFKKPYLCNYLMMQFLFFLAEDASADFNTMACIRDLRNKFDLSVNYIFYSNVYIHGGGCDSGDIKIMFGNIVDMLEKNFDFNYLNLTKLQVQLLKGKLRKVRLNIGNLPRHVTSEEIEKFYDSVPPLAVNNYFKNHLLMLKHRFSKSLHYPQNETHFIAPDNSLGSSSVAIYVAKQNMIILPYGCLLLPMYSHQYNELYKYSLLGFILTHELIHAFDTHGLNLNSQGQYSAGLMAIRKNRNFQNSVNCLQNQLPTENIIERIADIVAIELVYKTFINRIYKQPANCLNENWNKLFYLNVAQFFCGKENLEFIDHDTDAERLNQIVINSKGFSRAFDCPENSKMNPIKKCRLY